jgi:hypothetical protein
MGADLHIHVYEGLTENDLKAFFSNTLGSKYFVGFFGIRTSHEDWRKALDKIMKTKNVNVGECSWLKAALLNDDESFIPDTIGAINELIGEELPTLDENLKNKIIEAFAFPNKTSYDINKKERVEKFLEENMGKKLFTVSW